MFIRSHTTTLLQLFCELSLCSQVIFKSKKVADVKFWWSSKCEWVKHLRRKMCVPLAVQMMFVWTALYQNPCAVHNLTEKLKYGSHFPKLFKEWQNLWNPNARLKNYCGLICECALKTWIPLSKFIQGSTKSMEPLCKA